MLVVAGSDSLERLGETGEETIQERHRHEIGKKAVMGSSDSLQRRRRSIIRDTGDLSIQQCCRLQERILAADAAAGGHMAHSQQLQAASSGTSS